MDQKKYKKIPIEILEKLLEVTDDYKALKGALIIHDDLDAATWFGVVAEIERLELEMLKLIDEITGTLGV